MKLFPRQVKFVLMLFVLALTQVMTAQTFRGGIAGTVQDSSGAVVPQAKISLTGTDTGYKRELESTSSGDYTFPDLPLGNYSIEVSSPGFQATKIDKIAVRPGQVYSLEIKLGVSTSTERVEVNAAAVSLDTVSSTNNAVVNEKAVENMPLNGRDFTQLIKIVPGYNGAGSLNGTRTNQNNYQIDGADNNDIWQNGSAANQGGVGSIAGVTIPIDAIDQFTVQSQANAESGRNGGGLISLAIKSGTNRIHGTAYYFNRNEFFAARSPFLKDTDRKPALRNQQFGGSIGGPIVHDKLFYFVNYERQKYTIANSASATEPTALYVAQATALLAAHGIPVNPLSLNVLSLWPQGNKNSGPAANGNFLDTAPQRGYSDNSIGKIDWTITPRQQLSARAFIGTGRQFANAGPNISDYYQVAPDITQNFTVVHNWAVTDHISNQLLAGVGVFNQTFNDQNHSQNIPALGLNTGVNDPSLFGAPTITISSSTDFDQVGPTQPLGRKDYTGHLTDTLTWLKGKHQFRVGGEFRRNYMDLQYQRNVRGTFTFSGNATAINTTTGQPGVALPAGATSYAADNTTQAVKGLADYLAGYVASSSFTQGTLRRGIYNKAFDIFAQDTYTLLSSVTLNYGVRYTYNGPFTSNGVISGFRPGAANTDGYGLQIVGQGLDSVYNSNKTNFAPRFGFSAQPSQKMVIRGTYGIYFDVPNWNGFFDNRPGNGGAAGVQANPTGATPVLNLSRSLYQWQTGVNPFVGASIPAALGLSTVDPNFKTAYVQNFNLNTQYQISRNTMLQISYVGSLGRRLFRLRDINQARPGIGATTAALQPRRPFYTDTRLANRTTIAAINQMESKAASNYHSLQAMLRTSNFHGLTAQGSYTFGHAFDNVSGTRGFAPQDSTNIDGEYGSADFDVRHTFNGYIVYEVPKFTDHATYLTRGWQGNAFITAYTGTPFSAKLGSTDNSGTGEFQDRLNQIGDPKAGLNRQLVRPAGATPYVQWYTGSAFQLAPAGTFGTTARNAFRGPGFATVDAAVVKNTYIHEGINLQLRAEMFNIFNRMNLANPSLSGSPTGSSFGRSTNTRSNSGAPGIGPGEPFNVQLAGKIIF